MTEGEAPAEVPQPVLTPLTQAAIFLVLEIEEGGEQAVRSLFADLAGLQRAVGFRRPEGGLASVVGVGSQAWDRLYGGARPVALHPLPEFIGARHRSVTTPGDVLLHIRAEQMYLCFELASQVLSRLEGAVRIADEVHGFQYWDARDLLGFVDGTENPVGAEAAHAVTVTAGQDPAFVGFSYVIVQKYLHDLTSWNELSVEQQERAIGRSKLDDIEMADKPTNSHVALNTIVDADGTERDILRQNMPFGDFTSGEFGTYFIGYTSDPSVIERMLENMFVGSPPGNHDRILDFSTAVTGGLFVVPTADFLADGPPAPADVDGDTGATDVVSTAAATEGTGGTLRIGSLRESIDERSL